MLNKQKNIYLWLSSLLVLVTAYQFSIKETLHLRQANQQHQQAIARAINIDADIEKYQGQLAAFNANTITSYSQDNLLELLSTFCVQQGLLIKEFPEPKTYQEADYTIVSNRIEVEGAFSDIVQLVYDLEHVHRIGSIVSLKYQSGYNRQAKKPYLTAMLTLNTMLSE